jgi:23S rRNA (uridine2552-2'-O)-methyltransferase
MKKRRRGAPKNQWQDHYTRRAQKENYPARSVYKLQEMQQKYSIIRKGDRVLDLGCAPGAWLLFAAKQTGPGGSVVGIDLQKIDIHLPPHAQSVQGDLTDVETDWPGRIGRDFEVVISDMAPATTGSKSVDAARSHGLCQAAFDIARQALKPGGIFVCKVFQGPDVKAFEQDVRNSFAKIKNFKPRSSRKASKELFIIGFGKKTPG